MKMKLTNQEILNIFNVLSSMDSTGSALGTYILAKNRKVLQTQVEALREAEESYVKNSPRAAEYQNAIQKLVTAYSTKKDGTPNVRSDGTQIRRMIPADRMEEFTVAKMKLDNDYNDIIVGMDAHARSIQELLREETEVDMRVLKLKDFPAEVNQQVMNTLFVLVDEETKTLERIK